MGMEPEESPLSRNTTDDIRPNHMGPCPGDKGVERLQNAM